MSRLCRICKKTTNLLPYRVIRRDYICGPCHLAEEKKYRPRKQQRPKRQPRSPRTALPKEKADRIRQYEAARSRRRFSDPIERPRIEARHRLRLQIKLGKIAREPCEVCGATPAEAHHDDYSKPLDVRWLCRPHHREHHRNLKAA